MTGIPIVTDVLPRVTKGLVHELEDLEIRGWVETIQTTALLRSARILKRVLETWGDLLSFKAPVLGNKRMSGDYPNYSIVEIGLITGKNPSCHLDSSERPSASSSVKILQVTTNDGKNRTIKSRKTQNGRRKGNLHGLANDTIKQSQMKENL